MIYLICFGFSVAFAYLAKRAKIKSNFIFFSALSILVTAVLAGLRGISVGIDNSNYYYNTWARAISSPSITNYLESYFRISKQRLEILFVLSIGTIAKGTGNYQLYLFLTHLIIVGGVYIGAFRMKSHADPVLTMTLFYLLYYNHSLNISRQYVAMAIIFAAAADIERGKRYRYLFFVAVAFLFHNSGILGLLPLLVYSVLYPTNDLKKVSLGRRALIGVLIVGVFFGFVPFAKFLISQGILSTHYSGYFLNTEAAIPKIVSILLVIEALSLIVFGRWVRRHDPHADFFLFCSIAFLVIYQLATVILYGKRIAAYLSFLNIVTLGMLPEGQKNLVKNERIVRICIVLIALVYWLYFYAYKNSSKTFPYVLGI